MAGKKTWKNKMAKYKRSSHTVHVIKYHFVWITKYRYKVLEGVIADRARTIIRQVCKRNHVEILKGHMEKDHVHLLVDAPPSLSPSKLMQYIKGVSSRKLQQEFTQLNKKYWDDIFGQQVIFVQHREQ